VLDFLNNIIYLKLVSVVLNIVSNIGSTITTSTTAGTVTENTGTCPPTANNYPGSIINFNSSVNIASCTLTMVITIII
jgi:hypothetical protein